MVVCPVSLLLMPSPYQELDVWNGGGGGWRVEGRCIRDDNSLMSYPSIEGKWGLVIFHTAYEMHNIQGWLYTCKALEISVYQ